MTNLAKTNHFDPLLEGEREELTAPKETTHDMINDDTMGDPEGAANRAMTPAYPDWALDDYEPSPKNYYGYAWPQGDGEHLIPKKSTIDSVVELHEQGMTTVKEMVAMAHQEQADTINLLKENYESILAGISDNMIFPVMQGIGSCTTTALVERAFTKHLFVTAYGSVRDPDKELPEYVQRKQDAVFEAAIKAGVWYDVHQHCWNFVQYKGSPRYFVQKPTINRLIKAAEKIDSQYRELKPATAPAREYVQTTLAC